jgi:hypothetical protein
LFLENNAGVVKQGASLVEREALRRICHFTPHFAVKLMSFFAKDRGQSGPAIESLHQTVIRVTK